MLGYRAGNVVGKRVEDLADPEHAPEIDADIEALVRGAGYTAERRYLSSEGRSVPVHDSTAVLHDEYGAVSRLAGFYIDMSEINARAALVAALADASATRDELASRQGFTDALLETVEVGIVSCDASGTNLTRNLAFGPRTRQ